MDYFLSKRIPNFFNQYWSFNTDKLNLGYYHDR